MWKLNYWA